MRTLYEYMDYIQVVQVLRRTPRRSIFQQHRQTLELLIGMMCRFQGKP